jgi:hypothetical protein
MNYASTQTRQAGHSAHAEWPGRCEKTELFNAPGETDARDRFGARVIKPGQEWKVTLPKSPDLNYISAADRAKGIDKKNSGEECTNGIIPS